MDQEVKNILKSAKEAIKNKNFKEVLKLCKSVIDKEKENYLAWVFSGAAAFELGNKDQAQAAYLRAVQICDNQAHAYQGLAQLYEKYNINSELIGVYSQLRKIFSNEPSKFYDYSIKYGNVLVTQGKFNQAIEIFYSLLKLNNQDKDKISLIDTLANLLSDKSINQKSEVFFECLKSFDELKYEKVDVVLKINENALGSMLNEGKDWRLIERQCNFILETYSPANLTSLTVLFEIYIELLIGDVNNKIDEKIETILHNENLAQEKLEYFKLIYAGVKLVKHLDQQNLNELRKCVERLEHFESKIISVYLENVYYAFVYDHQNVVRTSECGLSLISQLVVKELETHFRELFNFNLGYTNFVHRKFSKAVDAFEKVKKMLKAETNLSKLHEETFRYLIECYLQLNSNGKVFELMEALSHSEHSVYGCVSVAVKKYYETDLSLAFKWARSAVESNPDNHDCNFLLGKVSYDLLKTENLTGIFDRDELKNVCFQSNIKAIKLSPFRWESIYNLGNYYRFLIKDLKKALKCYQKAYELCHSLELCGLELVDSLLDEKEDDVAFNVLLKANEEIENCKWASLRLGVIYLKKGNFNEAIRLFYSVIRNDPNDFNMWECLADAYLKRGSFNAALKSFVKVIELNPESEYALYQIAHIKQTLKNYDQAIMDYFLVLNKMTNHIPTLKGLGETYYELAKQNIRESCDEKYLEHVESSIKYLTKAIYLRKDLCCLWKIIGDCCMLSRVCPKMDKCIMVSKSLVEKNFTLPETDLVRLNKLSLLKLAEECFKICCKLKPDCGSYWNDMGLNYFHQFNALKDPSQTLLMTKSKECLINAINIEPENFKFWNFLGILYSSKELNRQDLAQHCLLRSLQLNDSDAVSWTNLGVYYLLNANIKLANECFKKSQAIDPEYSVAWIGQAFIADTVSETEQSIDIYRHAVELALHTEAQYGYARIVSKISNDPELRSSTIYKDYIEFLNAVPLSSDCLVKYCDRIDTNPDAYFLCGVIFEKLSLPLTAMEYYKKCVEISNDDRNEISILARRGYARLLVGQKQYDFALIQYKQIDVKSSLEDLFSLARVFYKLGKYQQCCKIFENALGICSESEQSIIYTGMGMAQSKYNIQEAISSFFKSFQSKVICIQSLFALCSIGLLKNDMKLISAVFKELDSLKDSTYKFDIVKLKAIYFCLRKQFTEAIRYISKFVHEHPDDSKAWIELCLCLKRAKNFDLALTIGKVTLKINTQANLTLYENIQFLLLQQLKKNQLKDNDGVLLKMFEKTLHMFPVHPPSWNAFSQFLEVYQKEHRDFKQISAQISQVLATNA